MIPDDLQGLLDATSPDSHLLFHEWFVQARGQLADYLRRLHLHDLADEVKLALAYPQEANVVGLDASGMAPPSDLEPHDHWLEFPAGYAVTEIRASPIPDDLLENGGGSSLTMTVSPAHAKLMELEQAPRQLSLFRTPPGADRPVVLQTWMLHSGTTMRFQSPARLPQPVSVGLSDERQRPCAVWVDFERPLQPGWSGAGTHRYVAGFMLAARGRLLRHQLVKKITAALAGL